MPTISPAEQQAVQNAMAQAEQSSPIVQDPEAAAQSSAPNENQDHNYSENDQAGHIQTDAPEIGEHGQRAVVLTKDGGRHVAQKHAQKADGKAQKANLDRAKHVSEKRRESEEVWKSDRRSVAPNHRGKK